MMAASGRRRARGFSLIVVVAVMSILVAMGLMVLDAVYAGIQLAGGDRAAQEGLDIAEAGAVWGRDTLVSLIFPAGASTPDLTNLMNKAPLSAGDPLCPDNVTCSNFYLLTPSPWVAFASGEYRVAATCRPGACTTGSAATAFVVRSLGRTPVGGGVSQRLLELSVGQ